MTAAEFPPIRCEWRHAPGVYCPETATHLSSRVDASRDYWYVCAVHALAHERMGAVESSPLARTAETVPAAVILAWWPPKHRAASRADAKAARMA